MEWRPATPIGMAGYTVTLPAFSVSAPTWKGASEIVRQYNYTASRAFYLTNLPTKPTGVNFGLCIRYRIGDTVYRYKLWDDDDFILGPLAAPLYNKEIIKANFVLEVWSLEGEATQSLAAALSVITSIRNVPTDLRSVTATALAYSEVLTYADLTFAGTAYNPLGSPLAPPTPDVSWYLGSAITEAGSPAVVTGWPCQTDTDFNLDTVSGAGFKVTPSGWNSNYLYQAAAGCALSGSDFSTNANDCYAVFQLNSHADGDALITLACGVLMYPVNPSGTLRFESYVDSTPVLDLTIALNTKYIVRVTTVDNGVTVVNRVTIYNLATLAVVAEGQFTVTGTRTANSGFVGIGNAANTITYYIGEILCYEDEQNYAAVLAYLQQKYNGSVQFATSGTFNDGNMWEDNS